mgnify:CR=1 FL=1
MVGCVGLVGFSGSGKTTFAKLVLRFFEPQSGKVEIDHQDLSTVTTFSIRHSITMIPQDPGLFNRSILENIDSDKKSNILCKIAYIDQDLIKGCDEYILFMKLAYHIMVTI